MSTSTQAKTTSRLDKSNALSRSLNLIYVYALATGAIFTFMCYWDGIFMSYTGPATFLGFGLMTVAVLPIAFLYAELSTMLPSAGSALVFNTVGLNKHMGFWSSWLILLCWICVPTAGVLGILDWILYQFKLELSTTGKIVICIAALAFWCVLSLFKNVVAGKVQTAMLLLGIAGVLITAVLYLISGSWSFSNFDNFFSTCLNDAPDKQGGIGWVCGLAFLITPFFGFETVPALVEEGTFPIKDQKKAILGSVLTCGAVYVLFYFALAGMAPYAELTHGGDCSPFISIEQIVSNYGWGAKYALFLGVVGVLFPIGTSVLGFWYSGVRMLYAMGRQNFLPKIFAKTNRYSQPIVANLLIFALSVVFLVMPDISDFFNLMAFACSCCYIITSISGLRLAKTKPEWKRPYKIPGGNVMRVLSLAIATVIAVFCAKGQSAEGWFGFGIAMLIGGVLWLNMILHKWKKEPVWMLTPDGEQEF